MIANRTMRTFKIYKLLIFIFSFFLIQSCQSDYTKLVKKELASNKRYDSIFHGLKFGQTRKEFYDICWQLNKEGVATHGQNNDYVQTILDPKDSTQATKRMVMLFYARFNAYNKITAMDMKFSYSAWAPWNKDLQSDKLLPVVKDTLLKWYPGNEFITTKNNAIVKVDGNRQIQVKIESDRDISVLIENLEYKYNSLVK